MSSEEDVRRKINYVVKHQTIVRDDWTDRQRAIALLIQEWLNQYRWMPCDYTVDEIRSAIDRSRAEFLAIIAKESIEFDLIPEIAKKASA